MSLCCNKIEGTPFRLIVCSLETEHDAMCNSDCRVFSVDMNGKEIEEYSLLDCNDVYFGESPAFRRNISSPSLGSKNKPNKKSVEAGDSASRFFSWIILRS
jgi:hypothetical protein